jgi:hypothetical protein
MKSPLALLLLGSLAISTAFATTYVRVEKDGTKTYSDRPIPGGQPVEIQSAQTYSPPPPPAQTPSRVPREQQLLSELGEAFKYESCTLNPENDRTFMNPESVTVGVALKPALRVGDVVDLRVDGTAVSEQPVMSFTMRPVFRGSHTVSVAVKDRFGRQLCNSSSVFHVHQPSLNSPTRQAPPPKPGPAWQLNDSCPPRSRTSSPPTSSAR